MKIVNSFEWKPLSAKQLKVMTWWCDGSPYHDWDGIICDGAVRSGKTISMAPSFINWAMTNFNGKNFCVAGKSIGALRRNLINTLKSQIESLGLEYEESRTENVIAVRYCNTINYFYLFGGKDESSQDLIQGVTLAGILLDEVALMPRSFVMQAEARCSVEGAKLWYNCNPKDKNHWFKKEYVDISKEKRLLYLHFTMADNLTLSDNVKERYERMFSGVFYERNILGLWVTAEGKIYTSFTKRNILKKEDFLKRDQRGNYVHPLKRNVFMCTIGVDFGGSKSSHAFNLTGFTKGFQHLITLKERRIKDELTPTQLEREFLLFVQECRIEYPTEIVEIRADSAEQVLIRGFRTVLRKNKIAIPVKNAIKGEIIDRIRFYSSMMSLLRYYLVDDCVETIESFETAVWDDKHEDVRLDDGTVNIDNLDAQEYSSEPYMKAMIDMRR